MTIKAKICGITTEDALHAAVDNGADFIGFVFFAPSPRYIKPKDAARLAKQLPNHVKSVAVCVDMSNEELDALLKTFKPDYLQFHGEETQERIYDVHIRYAIPVIKAIAVRSSDDVARGISYSDVADMLLFDAKAPSTAPLPGGNGLAFDWTLLKSRQFQVPWLLSGGLNSRNVKDAIKTTGATMVDISSAVECEPGIKDPQLVEDFLKKVKSI